MSVIVPCYNAAATLPACLQAILSSDFNGFEVIVVDDGSTDDSAQVARRFAVKLISRGDGSSTPGAARNTGVKAARGNVFIFIDADVVIDPQTIKIIAEDLQQHPEIAGVLGMFNRRRTWENLSEMFFDLQILYRLSQMPPLTYNPYGYLLGVRKSDFEAVGKFAENMPTYEDCSWGHRFFHHGRPGFLVDSRATGEHLKKLSGKSLFDDYYSKVYNMSVYALTEWRQHRPRPPLTDYKFADALGNLLPLALLILIPLLALVNPALALVCTAMGGFAYLGLHLPFYNFCRKSAGNSFMVKAAMLLAAIEVYSSLALARAGLRFICRLPLHYRKR